MLFWRYSLKFKGVNLEVVLVVKIRIHLQVGVLNLVTVSL